MTDRLERLEPKIDEIKSSQGGGSYADHNPKFNEPGFTPSEIERIAQTAHLHNQPTGTIADESAFMPPGTELVVESTAMGHTLGSMHHYDGSRDMDEFEDDPDTMTRTRGQSEYMTGDQETSQQSQGQQYLEEELYKLRVRGGSQSAYTHKTWEVAREEYDEDDEEKTQRGGVTESGLPEIPDTNAAYTEAEDPTSPPLPPVPIEAQPSADGGQPWTGEELPPPWQRIHQRLLSWAIVWPVNELDSALNSTTRGHQIDEVALSIWSTQTYKRYVRAKMTDSPQGRVDRLFVPPNMADAISNAVYNGRHGDACAMLRDLWAPFGLEGMPRLLIVLAKHRSDEAHWVVHRCVAGARRARGTCA
jgi:hypothetical protein